MSYDKTKRAFDFIVALLALLMLAPVIGITAVLIRIKLGSPILFRQIRPGQHGAPIEVVKFRTMSTKNASNGEPLPDEQRLTRFGAILRSTSIDEIPGLWNVLCGDMSLVGPRPLLVEYLTLYSAFQARRHEVKPGVTGWAQVNGRNAISWEEKFKLDVWYVDNRSFRLDCRILLSTLKKVIERDGITADGHVTNERFRGSSVDRHVGD